MTQVGKFQLNLFQNKSSKTDIIDSDEEFPKTKNKRRRALSSSDSEQCEVSSVKVKLEYLKQYNLNRYQDFEFRIQTTLIKNNK